MSGQRSLIHALQLLNRSLSELESLEVCGVTRIEVNERGTYKKELILGIKRLGFKYSDLDTDSKQIAYSFLEKYLKEGAPIIISVGRFQHWIVLAWKEGDNYVCIDPSENELVGSWNLSGIIRWMTCAGKYYAIAIKQP